MVRHLTPSCCAAMLISAASFILTCSASAQKFTDSVSQSIAPASLRSNVLLHDDGFVEPDAIVESGLDARLHVPHDWILTRHTHDPSPLVARWLGVSCRTRTATAEEGDHRDQSTTEKLLWLAGASLVFSGFDYVGFNLTRYDRAHLVGYRFLQLCTQAGLTWLLTRHAGIPAAVAFNLIWWTFGHDFLYYGYAEVFNPGNGWESRGDLQRGVLSNRATWAYWTPVGIARGMKRNRPIAGDTLVAQSLIGAVLGIAITVHF